MLTSFFKSRTTPSSTSVDAKTLQTQLRQGKISTIIDVRSPEEYAGGHIEGTRLLPLATISTRHHEIPRDQPVIVLCRSGMRSHVAIKQLSKLGFTNLVNLDSGLNGWQRAGLPLTK